MGVVAYLPARPRRLPIIATEDFRRLLKIWFSASTAERSRAVTGTTLVGWPQSPIADCRDAARHLSLSEDLVNAALCRLDALARDYDPNDRRRPQYVDADGQLAIVRADTMTRLLETLSDRYASCEMHLVRQDGRFYWSARRDGASLGIAQRRFDQ